jgi:hypothetical protein
MLVRVCRSRPTDDEVSLSAQEFGSLIEDYQVMGLTLIFALVALFLAAA